MGCSACLLPLIAIQIFSSAMPVDSRSQVALRSAPLAWRLRDFITACALLFATACVVLWQNAHVAILWDLGYVLDSAARIAAGQMPYRDFPFAHAPLTFLIQAAIIRITGRVYFHHVLYVAAVGGIGTILTWRLALRAMHGRIRAAWPVALSLAAPLVVVGIYCVFPFPSYDCDCSFWMLVALWFLQRLTSDKQPALRSVHQLVHGFVAGAVLCVPLFFKQNMGLPFLAAAICAVLLVLFVGSIRRDQPAAEMLNSRVLLAVLVGAVGALLVAAFILNATVGIGNYIFWTIRFAAKRRLPEFGDMLRVYMYPSLAWMLPSAAVAFTLLCTATGKRRWAQIMAFARSSQRLLSSRCCRSLSMTTLTNAATHCWSFGHCCCWSRPCWHWSTCFVRVAI